MNIEATIPEGEKHQAALYKEGLLALPTPVFIKDKELRYVDCNQAFADFVGVPRAQLLGKTVFDLWDPELARIYHEADLHLLESGEPQIYEASVNDSRGRLRQVQFNKSVVVGPTGETHGIIGVAVDITESNALISKLSHMAHTDPLTQLWNRTVLADAVNRAVVLAERRQNMMALLALDLDRFKPVNDKHGHGCGDLVLQEVADRMIACVRGSDSVFRVGGDEFIILLDMVGSEDQVKQIAQKLIDSISAPIKLGCGNLQVGVSIGIVQFRAGDEFPGVDEMLEQADRLMYQAKRENPGTFRIAE